MLPGPRARFPFQLMMAMRRDPLGFLTRLARDHGDVVHFDIVGRRYVLLAHPDHIHDVLVTQTAKFTKGPALRAAKVTLGEGLLTSEGDVHRRQRRLAQPAFHPARVQAAYGDVFVRFARTVAGAWESAVTQGRPIDVHAEMGALTLRIVAETLFGADVGEEEVRQLSHAMDVSVKMFDRARSPFAKILNRLPLPSNYRYLRAYGRLAQTIDRFIRQGRKAASDGGAGRGDLLSVLLRARDTEGSTGTNGDGSGMSDRQLRDECYTLFTAGHETTANALTFTWHLLGRHPEVEAELHREVDAALVGRDPTPADAERLPYTRAVVAESMRLYPPAWITARECREACTLPAAGDVPEAARKLSPGAVVLMSQWVTHRDGRWWAEPEKFDPGRWLVDAKSAARPRYAYFPFGGGPRQCIGESFAWLEMVLVVATIARRWRLLPAPAATALLDVRPTITLRPRDPLLMTPVARANLGAIPSTV